MRLRKMWVLGLGLSWLCVPAQAAPSPDGHAGKGQHHGAASLQLAARPLHASFGKAPKNKAREGERGELSMDRGAFGGARQVPLENRPPGLVDTGGFLLPPGLPDEGSFVLPRITASDAGVPVPEPTGLMLFAAGLLLAGASERQRRTVRRRN